MSEKQFLILMACHLSVKYEDNHLSALPNMLYHVDKRLMRMYVDKRLMRMLWSMVLKAVDRSSRINTVTLPLSILRLMTFCTFFKRAVSVE